MAQAGISSAPGTSGDEGPLPGAAADPAERARYEREVAALDLSDAEQADWGSTPQADLAARLYDSADRHRRLAEQLGTASVPGGVDAEETPPVLAPVPRPAPPTASASGSSSGEIPSPQPTR